MQEPEPFSFGQAPQDAASLLHPQAAWFSQQASTEMRETGPGDPQSHPRPGPRRPEERQQGPSGGRRPLGRQGPRVVPLSSTGRYRCPPGAVGVAPTGVPAAAEGASPAPRPCPPWPTRPTPLLLAKPWSPRWAEATPETSCSSRAWAEGPETLGPEYVEEAPAWRPWHCRLVRALRRRRGAALGLVWVVVRPVSALPCVLCVPH